MFDVRQFLRAVGIVAVYLAVPALVVVVFGVAQILQHQTTIRGKVTGRHAADGHYELRILEDEMTINNWHSVPKRTYDDCQFLFEECTIDPHWHGTP